MDKKAAIEYKALLEALLARVEGPPALYPEPGLCYLIWLEYAEAAQERRETLLFTQILEFNKKVWPVWGYHTGAGDYPVPVPYSSSDYPVTYERMRNNGELWEGVQRALRLDLLRFTIAELDSLVKEQ